MTDLSRFIIAKSDQLNADDLLGGPRTVTVTRVRANESSPNEQPISVYFEGDGGKPFKPCKSMRRVLVAAWGADAAAFIGRQMTLYRDPEIKFGGLKVGGIRISHMSHLKESEELYIALTEARGKKAPYIVQPLGSGERAPERGPAEAPAQTPVPEEIRRRAELAAQQGAVTFRAFWNLAEVKPHWDGLRRDLETYKAIAAAADQRGAPTEDDPFSAVVDDEGPSEEERARAAAEAGAEMRARDAMLEGGRE